MKLMKQLNWLAPLAGALAVSIGVQSIPAQAQTGPITDRVKARGELICGVNNQLPGFGNIDENGNYVGFDIDICRAVAAALFGDPDKIQYVYLTAANRQSAMQSGEVDIMSRNTTWTLTRDREWAVTFGPTTYYDGQGFMVKKELGVEELEDLDGATICVIAGTTTELNLADTFRARGIAFTPVTFDGDDSSYNAYDEGRCDAITSDQSALISRRATLQNPDDHVILGDVISKEPLGPLVSQGDESFSDIMNWTVYALFYAEERGITSANVEEFLNSEDPDILRFLGQDGNLGEVLGLEPDWTVNVIKAVGNYGEIFDRHLTPLGVARGLNQPYTQGGIQYAPPFR
ncbi:amino acid ABC transporter substrate-binding protein [Synechococcus sp. Nb3U1]|uniref:amino acid ABC transporter substrate-binding protein n=1 Tax=Synechococcus sp. Nb3U1 TaxID=1914529 RepID=UPI001F465AB9|nr:amino acid ABC transporter substrate-binding protein [Synechococcus sp. Nb3U1]MCF2971204.1 amino acid ABC transporter substrate-binding protein [Synechococcus sp. Nb3U1]